MENRNLPQKPTNPYEPPKGKLPDEPPNTPMNRTIRAGKLVLGWTIALAVLTLAFSQFV